MSAPDELPAARYHWQWFIRLATAIIVIDDSARSSLWWDIQIGKQTEVRYLNQVIVEEWSKIGVNTPVNEQSCS